MRSSFSRLLSILVLAVTFVAVPSNASAQALPYHARGTAQLFLFTGDIVGTGNATHLGRYTEKGHVTATVLGPGVFAASGDIVYTAANGDELWAKVAGVLDFVNSTVVAKVIYVGGTGRFTNATGGSILTGILPAFAPVVEVAVQVVGGIQY